jgi:hypothetical protein
VLQFSLDDQKPLFGGPGTPPTARMPHRERLSAMATDGVSVELPPLGPGTMILLKALRLIN